MINKTRNGLEWRLMHGWMDLVLQKYFFLGSPCHWSFEHFLTMPWTFVSPYHKHFITISWKCFYHIMNFFHHIMNISSPYHEYIFHHIMNIFSPYHEHFFHHIMNIFHNIMNISSPYHEHTKSDTLAAVPGITAIIFKWRCWWSVMIR